MVTRMVNSMPFSEDEKRGVYRAIHERRDVRAQFLPTPIPAEVLGRILDAAHHAPSVGFMQPWDFVVIEDPGVRRAVHDNFERANRSAASVYAGEQREAYSRMKLAGILEAPVNLCVTCDHERTLGSGSREADGSRDRSILHGLRRTESLAGGARRIVGCGMGEHSGTAGTEDAAGNSRRAHARCLSVYWLCVRISTATRFRGERLGASSAAFRAGAFRSLDESG